MEINGGEIIRNELSQNAMGGSELMAYRMANTINPELLKEFQIIHSRVRNIDESKIRILVCHDLAGDPESDHLKDGGWNRFHKIVFVSNWQMQSYINHYGIPWSKCIVMHNAIEPIDFGIDKKKLDTIRLVYHTTPHRGLHILLPVFAKLAEEYDNITLDVYSSFGVYGWHERDEHFKALFDACKEHPKINYLGAVSNEEIREALKDKHIYAYPSTWTETSCLSLIEAMSAGLFCVHPNLGALYETAGNITNMYQFNEDAEQHAAIFYNALKAQIDFLRSFIDNDSEYAFFTELSVDYVKKYYNWQTRKMQWEQLLQSMLEVPRAIPKQEEVFVYRTS